MITVEFDSREVSAGLSRLLRQTGNLSPVLRDIGEMLEESTKQRFASTTSPDGTRWAANQLSTLEHKRGASPLTGEGTLGNTIDYQLHGTDTLELGSPMEYAAMMQFGGTQAEFAHLWGDIPARPFLGLSGDDNDKILDTLARFLQN